MFKVTLHRFLIFHFPFNQSCELQHFKRTSHIRGSQIRTFLKFHYCMLIVVTLEVTVQCEVNEKLM